MRASDLHDLPSVELERHVTHAHGAAGAPDLRTSGAGVWRDSDQRSADSPSIWKLGDGGQAPVQTTQHMTADQRCGVRSYLIEGGVCTRSYAYDMTRNALGTEIPRPICWTSAACRGGACDSRTADDEVEVGGRGTVLLGCESPEIQTCLG
jgi:hypothetical protein